MISTLILAALAQANDNSEWTGSLNLSAAAAISDQDTQSLLFTGNAERRMGPGELRLRALYAYARQTSGPSKAFQTTEDRWSAGGRYDYDLSDGKYFGYGSLRFERNSINDLDLRTLAAIGLGTYLQRSDSVRETGKFRNAGDTEWRVSGGLSYLTEKYSGSTSSEEFGLDFGSLYRRQLSDAAFLEHDLAFIPAFGDFGDYFLISDLGIGMSVADAWQLKLSWIYDYDSTPAPGKRKDNQKYALGLGYRF